MTDWNQLPPTEKHTAKTLFTALSSLDCAVDRPEHQITFSALYSYTTEARSPHTEEVERALAQNPKLRDDFHHLLAKTAYYRLPRVAAASSGPITLRETEGFKIELRTSRVAPEQTFVTITLPEGFSYIPPYSYTILKVNVIESRLLLRRMVKYNYLPPQTLH
jgi:hypothetical protein